MQARFRHLQAGKASRHSARARLSPSLLQYDFLSLSRLARDVGALVQELPPTRYGALALDLGSSLSPYRALAEAKGYRVETLDLTRDEGADYAGAVEATGLPDGSYDLVLCTQVLEHCDDPWQGVAEIRRILKPGGRAILTVPHVWFYHPHPHDHWRFTQEGLIHLCSQGGLRPMVLLAQGGTALTCAQVLNFIAYGVLGRWGAPAYAVVNLLGMAIDRIAPDELFCHNFACLAARD